VPPGRFGLCDRCAHQRLVRTSRSVFSMCGRHADGDRRYPKYPPVPVGRCVGFQERTAPD